ncbi:MAG: nucleotidyltransferase domain-containing protein [Chloroflexi bacterium]|nr:nucleotidyltransferase domain-containing protein [Chloroflexota bacterium]
MTTTPKLAPDKLMRYMRSAKARWERERHEAEGRRERAWELARTAGHLLKEQFGATRVIAFGSLAHGAWFSRRSDIDLAVEGIPPQEFWRAWCALDHLEQRFEIDLTALESAPVRLREEIERVGVSL